MRKIMLTILFLLMMSGQALAVDAGDFGLDEVEKAIPESAQEIIGQESIENASADGIFQRLWEYLRGHVKQAALEVLRPVAAVVAVAAVCSAAESGGAKGSINYVNFGGCLAIAALTLGDVNTVTAMGQQAIGEMGNFSRVLLPTLSTVAASAGAISSAGAKYAATVLFLDVLTGLTENFILPLVGAFTAAAVASAVIGDGRLKSAVKLVKWLSKLSLTALVTVFTAYLSLTGIAASGADAAAAKAAKAVISTFIPVVGKLVSGASESLAAGAGIIRNAVGIFGLGAVIAVCTAPFLALGLRYVLFKAASAVVGVIAGDRIGALVEDIGAAYGMVLACVGTGAIFMFISILSMIRTVV